MLRFAPRYGIISPCLSRRIQARHLRAVNDNGAGSGSDSVCQDEALDAALRLFAAHGFSAAARARDAAVIAERSGEPSRVEFWVEVCATLDRRMARDFLKRKRS
ncbi:hypothetical protein ACQKO5_14860 [Novosphingobium subterraneum]|uniref:hypothetical protein n=1 Tax=Novosphingobium subterraneum TaxID=48936 RepID=UPI003D02B689